jgi:hypothetical protein
VSLDSAILCGGSKEPLGIDMRSRAHNIPQKYSPAEYIYSVRLLIVPPSLALRFGVFTVSSLFP